MTDFADRLQSYIAWQRKSVPVGTPVAMEFVAWLLRNRKEPMPLTNFYRAAVASEPTARKVVLRFKKRGFVELCTDQYDYRSKLICPTDRFDKLVTEMQGQLARLVA